MEDWLPIMTYGLNGKYEVSSFGRIRHARTKNLRALMSDNYGYQQFTAWSGEHYVTCKVHRCVASAFIENRKHLQQINHRDGNKKNNHVENLEWCTTAENVEHAYRTGLHKPPTGRKIAQLKDGTVVAVFNSVAEAARETHLDVSNVSKAARGHDYHGHKRRFAGGFQWEYLDGEERTP